MENFEEEGCDIIKVNEEEGKKKNRQMKQISEIGKKEGIEMKNEKKEEEIKNVMDEIEIIIVMKVNKGLGGKKLIEKMMEKIRRVREMVGERNIEIEVEGGIKKEKEGQVVEDGEKIIVEGQEV